MSKTLSYRRVHWPLLISLTLIGSVAGIYVFLLSGLADADVLWVTKGIDTRPGGATTMTVYIRDQPLYAKSSFNQNAFNGEIALLTTGPLAIFLLGGAFSGVCAAYVISRWLFHRSASAIGIESLQSRYGEPNEIKRKDVTDVRPQDDARV